MTERLNNNKNSSIKLILNVKNNFKLSSQYTFIYKLFLGTLHRVVPIGANNVPERLGSLNLSYRA